MSGASVSYFVHSLNLPMQVQVGPCSLNFNSYMAPEQFRGKPLYASDQYSLGIVVYEWLCGTLPFHGTPVELLYKHENVVPPLMCEKVPSLSLAIEEVVQKALAKNPKERYASVKDFAQAFQEACHIEQAGNGSQRTILMSSLTSQSHSATSGLTKRARPIVATPPEDSSVIWNVPYHRNMFFTGREQVLASLHDTFCSQKRLTQTQALSGLGGIGKTQITIEYVYRYHTEVARTATARATAYRFRKNDAGRGSSVSAEAH